MLSFKSFPIVLFALIIGLAGCKKDNVDTSAPVLRLTPDNVLGKSGRVVEATLYITAPNTAKDVVIYKTINLQKDPAYGNGGTVTAVPTSTGNGQYEYHFTYQLKDAEVDKLVGFNFRFTDAKGLAAEKDLTVNTTTSGQQIIYSRRWKLTSRLWTSVSPVVEDKKPCEDDNIFVWNADSTYNVQFGGSACTYDGFNVFDKWKLSDDEKTFTQIYHSVFDPANITTETYTVKTLNRDKMVLVQLIDLTIFGLSDKEAFESTYVPAP
ncbi:hypothetical protein [Ferruginibacter sp. HRS2-29]|uniref:hypothetical protein n=1 Tax=Ferruginibacter sp. HRS2-29 TaxID=2487334 RepID=UPI0020CDD765|nr:hypothetical protein [Ferruginibacter sp. HRS2-29]MCP9753506.1 hypothetical protein [Ferruginibacter sp. HRS2-29]